MKEERVKLVAGNKSAEGLQPANRALDDPPLSEAPQRAAILGCRPDTTAAVRTDQLDPATGQALAQGIAVSSAIIDESVWNLGGDGLVQQRLDQGNFGGAGSIYVNCESQSIPVHEDHELAALAAFGGTNAITPFFCG